MNYYDKNAKSFTESTANVDISFLYDEFCKWLSKGAVILDAGCGSGRDIIEFMNRGYSVEAFDKSESMVKIASDRTGIDVKKATFENFHYTKKFDGIWCCASLLHVPFRDLMNTIKRIVKSLNDQGIIYMSFKYGEGERSVDGRDFTDMTEEKLSNLIKQVNNLEKLKVWKNKDVRPEKSEIWLNAIYKKITT